MTEVVVKRGSVLGCAEFTAVATGPKTACVIDRSVAHLYAEQLHLSHAPHVLIMDMTEPNKLWKSVEQIHEFLFRDGFDRDASLLVIGGGAALDMAGFAAATYLRGVRSLYVPTTLLAMVDASIGGKTGVNTPFAKNSIGAFWPSQRVWIDPLFLESLERLPLLWGAVEMLKHGVILDAEYFDAVHAAFVDPRPNGDVIEALIASSVGIKQGVVEEDAMERKGYRRILNFGHTVAHGVESAFRYQVSHGLAVAFGMVVESAIAERMGFCTGLEKRLLDIFSDWNLSFGPLATMRCADAVRAMAQDKKNVGGDIRIVTPSRIGQCHPHGGEFCVAVDRALLESILEEKQRDLCFAAAQLH